MMGSSGMNEKGKAPAFVNPFTEVNDDNAKNIVPSIPDVGEFDFLLDDIDMPFSLAGWEDVHQPVAQGIAENSGHPFPNPNCNNNPQINTSSNTVNTCLQEAPLLPEWNIGWDQKFMNQGHNTISSAGISTIGGQSNFSSFNRPQVNRDLVTSSFVFQPQGIAPVHTRDSVNFNTNQCGVQGKVEDSFLSLGIGGTQEAVSGYQPNNREVCDKLREAASAELKIASARRAMNQTFGQTMDVDFMDFQRNSSGISNQLTQVDRVASNKNEVGVHCTLNSGPSSSPYHVLQMQQNDMQLGIPRHDFSSRNTQFGYSDHSRSQSVYPGTLGVNSAQLLNSQQHNLNNLVSEFSKPSLFASSTPTGQLDNIRYRTDSNLHSESSINSPSLGLGRYSTRQNYEGHLGSLNAMPTQNPGGVLLSQRTTAPQVSWVGCGPASSNAPFPKRLGVEYNGRNAPQASQRHPSLMGTNLQATSRGQIHQFLDQGASCLPERVVRPSVGNSQDAVVQLLKDPRVAASTNASLNRPYPTRTAVIPPHLSTQWVQRQRTLRPTTHHSMPSTSPAMREIPAQSMQNASPAIRSIPAHLMPALSTRNRLPSMRAIPVGTPLHQRSIPVAPQTQAFRPVALPGTAQIRPSMPHSRPRIPVITASNASHITWKDPDATPKLSGYKCLLCKRDLALTSEGDVYQPTVPPPVAVLPCGHTFHDQCLQNITPQDQAKEPPCIPCAIGEN
ncbi:uncharacterized protein [Rutidosis leptorrhynchoides]|uniref:uncharacterized protein n=1 Tax=Rutidosis leptorrhynchoides TaxID=125765 RepID=UPI003A9A32FF